VCEDSHALTSLRQRPRNILSYLKIILKDFPKIIFKVFPVEIVIELITQKAFERLKSLRGAPQHAVMCANSRSSTMPISAQRILFLYHCFGRTKPKNSVFPRGACEGQRSFPPCADAQRLVAHRQQSFPFRTPIARRHCGFWSRRVS
jgi:hypothetical protein